MGNTLPSPIEENDDVASCFFGGGEVVAVGGGGGAVVTYSPNRNPCAIVVPETPVSYHVHDDADASRSFCLANSLRRPSLLDSHTLPMLSARVSEI